MNTIKFSLWNILLVFSLSLFSNCRKDPIDLPIDEGPLLDMIADSLSTLASEIRAKEIEDSLAAKAIQDSIDAIVTFNDNIRNREILHQPAEFPERLVLNEPPVVIIENGLICEYKLMEAAAGHTEFFASYPYSGMYPGQIYSLTSFENGGLRVIPSELRPLKISWSLQNLKGDIDCTMEVPSTSSYRNCQQEVLSNEITGPTTANIEFDEFQVFETSQLDLHMETSFSGFGVKLAGMLDLNNKSRRSHYFMRMDQIYYTVEVDVNWEKPSDLFSKLPDLENLPGESPLVYVNSMKYGRRLIMAISSNYQSSRVTKLLSAAARFAKIIGPKVNFKLNAENQETFEGSTIKVFIMGGGAEPAAQLISDVSTLGNFLVEGANYSKETPGALLGFSLNHLGDNSIAKHVNTARYKRRDCSEACSAEHNNTATYGGTSGDPFEHLFPGCAEFTSIQVKSGAHIDKIVLTYKIDDQEYKCSVGGGGGKWNEPFAIKSKVVRITGRSGRVIDALQLHFEDGTFTPQYGGGGGRPFTIDLDGTFAGIFGRSGDEIDRIGIFYRKD